MKRYGYKLELKKLRRRQRNKAAKHKLRLLLEQGHNCWICGKYMIAADVTIDHVIELRNGGTSDLSNLRLAHKICNLKRSNKKYGRTKANKPTPPKPPREVREAPVVLIQSEPQRGDAETETVVEKRARYAKEMDLCKSVNEFYIKNRAWYDRSPFLLSYYTFEIRRRLAKCKKALRLVQRAWRTFRSIFRR